MAIPFYNPVSDYFHKKLCQSFTFEEQLDVCIDHIHEFVSVINVFHGIRKCDLERCHVRLFLEGLEMYSKNLRESNHHLKKNFV